MVIKCPHCGSENLVDDNRDSFYCQYCGQYNDVPNVKTTNHNYNYNFNTRHTDDAKVEKERTKQRKLDLKHESDKRMPLILVLLMFECFVLCALFGGMSIALSKTVSLFSVIMLSLAAIFLVMFFIFIMLRYK